MMSVDFYIYIVNIYSLSTFYQSVTSQQTWLSKPHKDVPRPYTVREIQPRLLYKQLDFLFFKVVAQPLGRGQDSLVNRQSR